MKISFDLGTYILLLFCLIFLLTIILFPISKRNEIFGLRHTKCFESEEIWHKVHVHASIATIPILILTFFCIFLNNAILKTFLAIFMITLAIIVWNLVVKYTNRNYFQEKKKKEQEELNEQIKKESGWR